METTFIYILCEPDSQEVRYLGKSDNPNKRLIQHFSRAKKNRNHLSCWLNGLLADKKVPHLEIVEEIPTEIWQDCEREYIKTLRALGFRLVNHTDGGEGAKYFLGKKFSLEHRQRLSTALKGRVRSSEHCQRISASRIGQKPSLETREKLSASLRITKLGNKNWLGKKHSPETIEKMSAARIRHYAITRNSGKLPGNCKISIGAF